SRERLREMMASFAKNLDTAKKEWRDPHAEKSETSRALQKYLDETDYGEAFFKALQGTVDVGKGVVDYEAYGADAQQALAKAIAEHQLRSTEQAIAGVKEARVVGDGNNIEIRAFGGTIPEHLKGYFDRGEIQRRSPDRRRAQTEELIFGEKLTGSAK